MMSLFSLPSLNFTRNTLPALLSHSPACLSLEGPQYLATPCLVASLDQSLQKQWKVIQKPVTSHVQGQRKILPTIIYWLNTTLSGKEQIKGLREQWEKMGERRIVYTLLVTVHTCNWLSTKNKVDSTYEWSWMVLAFCFLSFILVWLI